MRRTVLYDEHIALGAKFLEFNGWEMPLHYQGILSEHQATREKASLFDVSHMGRIEVAGSGAERLLDYLSTNQIAGKEDGTATYTIWCNAGGTAVDDLIVFRENADNFFVIVNAGNRQQDLAHLKAHSQGFEVTIQAHDDDEGLIALQGPQAKNMLAQLFPSIRHIKPMHFSQMPYKDSHVIISATGYTGAGGFELCIPKAYVVEIWRTLLAAGKEYGLVPAGLGARDILRLEMGYALYGHEISLDIAPTESIAAWAVKMKKDCFLGKRALEALEQSSHKRFEIAMRLLGPGVMREELTLIKDGIQIGKTTSGSFSPILKCSIAIGLVTQKLKPGDHLEVIIRGRRHTAEVVTLPFITQGHI